jgi:hypothetical protein
MVTAGGPSYARMADMDFDEARRALQDHPILMVGVAGYGAAKSAPEAPSCSWAGREPADVRHRRRRAARTRLRGRRLDEGRGHHRRLGIGAGLTAAFRRAGCSVVATSRSIRPSDLAGFFQVTQRAIRQMVTQGSGHIVDIMASSGPCQQQVALRARVAHQGELAAPPRLPPNTHHAACPSTRSPPGSSRLPSTTPPPTRARDPADRRSQAAGH